MLLQAVPVLIKLCINKEVKNKKLLRNKKIKKWQRYYWSF